MTTFQASRACRHPTVGAVLTVRTALAPLRLSLGDHTRTGISGEREHIFNFTLTETTDVVFDSCEADYDTMLTMYRSTADDLLVVGDEVARNDDGGCCPSEGAVHLFLDPLIAIHDVPSHFGTGVTTFLRHHAGPKSTTHRNEVYD